MAILLFCEGVCKKQMGSLEPFIVHEDKYMCTKCAPVVILSTPKGMPELLGLWTSYEQINQALGLAHWELQFTPDRSKCGDVAAGFAPDSYIWWNRDSIKSRAVEVFVNGNWIFWKCDAFYNWSQDTSGNIQQAKPNIEWIVANWSKK